MNGNITWGVYNIIYSKYNQQCDIKIYQVGWTQNDSIRGNMGSSPMTMRIHAIQASLMSEKLQASLILDDYHNKS